ncbi:MAG: acetyl-CoA hydrolase/transferase C-terminal domain-containing protein [Pseudomonadota bacterium]
MQALDIRGAAALLQPGMTVFIHGMATEPRALTDYLAANPEHLRGVRLITSFIPGINTVNLAGLAADSFVVNTMAQRAYAPARDNGQADWLRLAYSEVPDYLQALPKIDLAFLHCGRRSNATLSTGVSGEMLPLAAELAERTCVFINEQMPIPVRGCDLATSQVDYAVTHSAPLMEYRVDERGDAASSAIADYVTSLVDDGDAIQAGIGVIPSTVFKNLRSRRGLRLYSGMISDAIADLADAGALDPSFPHTYGMALGTQRLFDWLHQREGFSVERVEVAHDRARVQLLDHFVAMNSALEVALDGSVNAEQIGRHVVSGRGGLPDYSTAASLAEHGRSIIALPAANLAKGFSRIVVRLANHDSPTLAVGRATHVITEHGVAAIKGVGPEAVAERLVAVADPTYRDGLRREWASLTQ